jgi:hypothetical protein
MGCASCFVEMRKVSNLERPMANQPDNQQVIDEFYLEEKRLKEMIHEYLHGMESDFVVAWQYQQELYRIQSKLKILNKLVDYGIPQIEQDIAKHSRLLSEDNGPYLKVHYERRLIELNEELINQIIRKALPGNHELISELIRKTLFKIISGFGLHAQSGSIREMVFTSVRGNLRITFPDMKKGKNADGMLDYYLRILEKQKFIPSSKGKLWSLTFKGSTDEQHDQAMAVLAKLLLEHKIMVMSDNYVKIKGTKNS